MIDNVPTTQEKEPTGVLVIKPEKTEPSTKMEFSDEITKMISNAGTLVLTDKEREILFAPVDEKLVEIRPDGLIYLPWLEYVTRLRGAFGIGWSLIPQGMPKIHGKNDSVTWGFWLIIRGVLCGFALGECDWRQDNAKMSATDACEGAKSNALMRLCKGIGIGLELWQPAFIRDWISKHAEQIDDPRRPDKKIWVRRGTTFITMGEVVGEVKKTFGESRVEDVTTEEVKESISEPSMEDANLKTEFPSQKNDPKFISANRFADYHDEIIKCDTLPKLRTWWDTYGPKANKNLIEDHFKMLNDLKNDMKRKLSPKKEEK